MDPRNKNASEDSEYNAKLEENAAKNFPYLMTMIKSLYDDWYYKVEEDKFSLFPQLDTTPLEALALLIKKLNAIDADQSTVGFIQKYKTALDAIHSTMQLIPDSEIAESLEKIYRVTDWKAYEDILPITISTEANYAAIIHCVREIIDNLITQNSPLMNDDLTRIFKACVSSRHSPNIIYEYMRQIAYNQLNAKDLFGEPLVTDITTRRLFSDILKGNLTDLEALVKETNYIAPKPPFQPNPFSGHEDL